MAIVTFNIPCANGITKRGRADKRKGIRHETRTGTTINLDVGDTVVRCVLQHGTDGKPEALVHYASGCIIGRLNAEKVRAMMEYGHAHRLNDRGAAKAIMARAVAINGADVVLAKMAAMPVINP
jgi:hypothetical protein